MACIKALAAALGLLRLGAGAAQVGLSWVVAMCVADGHGDHAAQAGVVGGGDHQEAQVRECVQVALEVVVRQLQLVQGAVQLAVVVMELGQGRGAEGGGEDGSVRERHRETAIEYVGSKRKARM